MGQELFGRQFSKRADAVAAADEAGWMVEPLLPPTPQERPPAPQYAIDLEGRLWGMNYAFRHFTGEAFTWAPAIPRCEQPARERVT